MSIPIEPDTKDWTWVLGKKCEECGFEANAFPREQIGEMVRANAAQWRQLLNHPQVAQRPSDDRWSCLEYACHVRDVFRLYHQRLEMMLDQDDPEYPNWDQDQAAIDRNYAAEEPSKVANELEEAGTAVAERFDAVRSEQWARPGRRSDGARFTIESFGRYLIHDPIHHLNDVRRGYERLTH